MPKSDSFCSTRPQIQRIIKLIQLQTDPIKQMQQLRKQKLTRFHKHSLPTHPIHTHNAEQAARINLIQISHADFLQKQEQAEIDNIIALDFSIEDQQPVNLNTEVNRPRNNRALEITPSEEGRYQILNQFKRITEDLERIGRQRKYMHSDRSYRFGDKFMNITMRNPLAISSYVVSGGRKTPLARNHTQPPQSQYVIRQQRRLHKLRRSESKQESENLNSSNRKIQLRYIGKETNAQTKWGHFPFLSPRQRQLS